MVGNSELQRKIERYIYISNNNIVMCDKGRYMLSLLRHNKTTTNTSHYIYKAGVCVTL